MDMSKLTYPARPCSTPPGNGSRRVHLECEERPGDEEGAAGWNDRLEHDLPPIRPARPQGLQHTFVELPERFGIGLWPS